MRTAIVLGGHRPALSVMQRELAGCDRVICADRGADWAMDVGVVPDLMLGDMDSVHPMTLERLQRLQVPEHRSPVHKDETDGQLAVDEALACGSSEVVLLGAFGGRYDHTLSTYMLLRRLGEAGVRAWAVGDGGRVEILGAGRELELRGRVGETFSVMPFSDGMEVEYIRGAEYPLEGGIPMPMTLPLGVSNVLAEDTVRIRLRSGWGLVFIGMDIR